MFLRPLGISPGDRETFGWWTTSSGRNPKAQSVLTKKQSARIMSRFALLIGRLMSRMSRSETTIFRFAISMIWNVTYVLG